MNRADAPSADGAPGRSERRGLHRDAVEALGLRIVSGELRPGEALPSEAELGDELDVSRTVVREAIKVLASKGLVVSRPRTGTRVQPRTSWDVIDHDVLDWIVAAGPSSAFYADLFEVRSIVEPQAAELAAIRRTDAQLRRIVELFERMEAVVDDRPTYIEIDLQLHAAILAASHNELLSRLGGTLSVALQAGRVVTTRVPGGPQTSIDLHRDVVDALVAGEPQDARAAMHALVAYATQDMEVVLADDASG